MIQFNLLPDVKVQFIKTQRMKRAVIVISLGVIAFSVGILIVLFSFQAVQKQHLGNLDKDIKSMSTALENTPDLTRILSIQNQLNTLPALYEGRPAVDRLPSYLDKTTPVTIDIAELKLDFEDSTLEVSGNAKTLEAVNSYVDTLKYATYTTETNKTDTQAFTSVVLKEFSRRQEDARYTISLAFDPVIFDITETVDLKVPAKVTTHAQVPGKAIFNGTIEKEEN